MRNVLSLVILVITSVLNLSAQSKQERAIATAVETLNQGILKPERNLLENIVSSELSYCHSNGKIENRTEFVDCLVNGIYIFSILNTSEQSIQVLGKTAIVRHLFNAKVTTAGIPADLKLGVLQVWQKKHGAWKLLTRQGYKL